MATFSASPSISCCTIFKPHKNPTALLSASISASNFSCSLPNRLGLAHGCINIPNSYPSLSVIKKNLSNLKKIRSVAEDTVIPEQQEDTSSSQGEAEATVSVPVSPSDILTMFFQAEGTMSEAAIPSVTSALQETEGISDLRVQVLEGIASVELKKKTTVQATGVASNLVEIIQNSGFKLQALNLSFEDEDAN
ncbi:hypothetical protein L2E82_33372 [Cichorium intybus]|uniref:Uncharacterized protein n=1 Tax=Cichorium intybus TaxID=13427 RepID=A0ACB9BJZ2_CICIN|nr:hypothetical protein L2E82_33372 [Cichorium intybus]